MKRTCDRCRAFWIDNQNNPHCELRHKIKAKMWEGIVVGGIPQEECRKPITCSELYENY